MKAILSVTFAVLMTMILGGCAESATSANSAQDDSGAIEELASRIGELDAATSALIDRVDDLASPYSLTDSEIDAHLNEAEEIGDDIDRVQNEVDSASTEADDLSPSSDEESDLDDVASEIEELDARIDAVESELGDRESALRIERFRRTRSSYLRSVAKSKLADAYVEAFDECGEGLKEATSAAAYLELSRRCTESFGPDALKAAIARFDEAGSSSVGVTADAPPAPPLTAGDTGGAKPSTVDCADFDMNGVDGGAGAGYFDISVRNMACGEAKRIILENAEGNSFAAAEAEGFECLSLGAKRETYQFRCSTAGDARAFRYWFGA